MAFVIDPQVAGELGEGTEMDSSVHPPVVSHLEYVLDYPGTDDLIQSFPVYLASVELRASLEAAGVRGIEWRDAVVSRGDFYEDYPPADPINYRWLIPGVPGDDCWIENLELVVSDRMMDVLRLARINDCEITPKV